MMIKLILEPSVYLVGKQTVVQPELDCFLADHGFDGWTTDSSSAGETNVEVGARVCYQSFTPGKGRTHAEHIRHLIEVGHGSCLEHAVWNLVVTGVSRSLSHELIRHRAGLSPSELSQRYVDCSDMAFVVPPALRSQVSMAEDVFRTRWQPPQFDVSECDVLLSQRSTLLPDELDGVSWFHSLAVALDTYRRLSRRLEGDAPADLTSTERRKWARQAARSVLPECTETRLFLTLNARAARHIIEMRSSRHADTEIRRLAVALYDVLVKDSPGLFSDYKRVPTPDGWMELVTKNRKV